MRTSSTRDQRSHDETGGIESWTDTRGSSGRDHTKFQSQGIGEGFFTSTACSRPSTRRNRKIHPQSDTTSSGCTFGEPKRRDREEHPATDRGGESSLRLASQKEGDKGTQLEGSKEDGLLSRGLGLFLEKANKRKGYRKTWNVFGPSKSIGNRDKTQTGWFSGARKLYLVC